MSSVDNVIEHVSNIIREDYDSITILNQLNQCLIFISRRLHFSDLEGENTVVTDVNANVQVLPTDFHYGLFGCRSDTNKRPIRVYDSKRLIDRNLDRLDSGGTVMAVAQYGRNLYYQRKPATPETLRLFYYKKPVSLVSGGDIPPYILDDFHVSLFVNFASWKLFARIEDGMEDNKPNTLYYKNEFYEALSDAVVFFKPEPKNIVGFCDELNMEVLY